MFTEDLNLFFSDFAQDALWKGIKGKVIIDSPDDLVIDGVILTPAPLLRFKSGQWQGIKEGDKVQVGNTTYKLTQSPRRENDGAISVVEILLC